MLSYSGETEFHLIDLCSVKKRRVAHSLYGSYVVACATADDRGFYLNKCFRSLAPGDLVKHVMQVDSRAFYDTITTFHNGREYRLRQSLERIRDSFENNDIDMLL